MLASFDFWKKHYDHVGQIDRAKHDAYFRKYLLAIADKSDGSFLCDKVVADFGCGPLGTLCWATDARARIGIDVLVDAYMKLGIAGHTNTVYVKSTESTIPLPTGYVGRFQLS